MGRRRRSQRREETSSAQAPPTPPEEELEVQPPSPEEELQAAAEAGAQAPLIDPAMMVPGAAPMPQVTAVEEVPTLEAPAAVPPPPTPSQPSPHPGTTLAPAPAPAAIHSPGEQTVPVYRCAVIREPQSGALVYQGAPELVHPAVGLSQLESFMAHQIQQDPAYGQGTLVLLALNVVMLRRAAPAVQIVGTAPEAPQAAVGSPSPLGTGGSWYPPR